MTPSTSTRHKRSAITAILVVSMVASLAVLHGNQMLYLPSSDRTLKHAANNSSPEDATLHHSSTISTSDDSENTKCPRSIQKARGIFRNKTLIEGLERVVLLTAANSAYYDFLQNWEYMAGQLGLQWVVLAMDEPLYRTLGPERSIPTDARYAVNDAVNFREQGFNMLSCNKLRSVLHILEACDVDVVFSDSDNVFFENPFQHDLGKLIRSGANYDYVYQPNTGRVSQPRQHACLANGERVKEGNTGFYYISRNSETLKQVIRDALAVCAQPENKFDDQKLFWNELRKHPTRHCTAAELDSPNVIAPDSSSNTTASLCCLDPFYYPTGRMPRENMITFHANFCRGKDAKVDKLQHARKDGYGWDPARIRSSDLSS